jgi:uncharacterized membrane protein YfcA
MDLWHWAGLAATTFVAALLYVVSGFGFAVLAAPLYLLFVDPTEAIQLVVIVSTALSILVIPGLRRAVAPGLLFRLVVGCLAGLPVGLVAFERADPILVRAGVGVMILAFAALIVVTRRRGAPGWRAFSRSWGRDLVAGAVSGIATALVGMAGPPVLIYLLLAGTGSTTVRANAARLLRAVLRRHPDASHGDNRHPRPDLACRLVADPCCTGGRGCRAPDRRSPRA